MSRWGASSSGRKTSIYSSKPWRAGPRMPWWCGGRRGKCNMGLAEVIVNRVARLGGTLVTETNLPVGTVRTPQFIPKITTKPEFELLLKGRMLRKPAETACYEISSVGRLTKRRSENANQTTLIGDSSDPAFDSFRRTTLAMTDPQSECFSFKRTYVGHQGEKIY